GHSLSARSGSVVTGGPTKQIFIVGLARLMASASAWSPCQPTVEVKRTRNSYPFAISMVWSAVMWCGGASSSFEPSSMPAGYASQTGYQYDSISRTAGQRELAPPSKFSKEGGFRSSVLRGGILTPSLPSSKHPCTPAGADVPYAEPVLARVRKRFSEAPRGPQAVRNRG